MTARCIPEQPAFANAAEEEVWRAVRDGLDSDCVVIHGQRVTDEDKYHEADLLVLMPGVGIVVVEVKGGSVWYDEGGYWQRRRGRPVPIDPVAQGRQAMFALRSFVAADPRWGRQRAHVVWAHAVVTPHQDWPEDFRVPELMRAGFHGRSDLQMLAERLRDQARLLRHDKQPPTLTDVELAVEILTRPSTTRRRDADDAEERASEAARLTREQSSILGVTRLLTRVEVRGGAGSGKTVLALEQARDLARGRHGPSQRVAVLCYSLGLAAWLKREVATWDRRHRPAFVGTFHEFGRQWGAPDGDRENSTFWEEDLPRVMLDLARGLDDKQRYDAVIVDEAQDFADSWWLPVLASLRDEETGGLYVYSDENQRIFARFGQPPVALVPLVLDHNLRNTKQIHSAFGPLAPSRMYARGGEGPDVQFVPASAEEALGAADDVVDALLDDWPAQHVALLTTGHRHPVQKERQELRSQEAYWETWWDTDDVFYGHVLGCKGLERRVVVLCVNDSVVRERARERLYVGMSRATDLLVVVGDPALIREVGGDAVARQLGIAPA